MAVGKYGGSRRSPSVNRTDPVMAKHINRTLSVHLTTIANKNTTLLTTFDSIVELKKRMDQDL